MEGLLRYFNSLLHVHNDKCINDILWAIYYLTETENDYIEDVVNSVDKVRIKELLLSDNKETQIAAIRVLGNICYISSEFSNEFIQAGCLLALKHIINSANSSTLREACWALSNISAGPSSHIQHLISLGLIITMQNFINGSVENSIKEEALWTIANACEEATKEQLLQMFKDGILKGLFGMIDRKEPKILEIILRALERLLEAGKSMEFNAIVEEWQAIGGMKKIEELQLHENKDIYSMVIRIFENYYQVEEL